MTLRVFVLACLMFMWAGLSFGSPRNRSCKPCHRKQWREWKASQHARTGTNSVFRFEYGSHAGAWCLGCHAPRTRSRIPLSEKNALRQGVDCITCHIQEGTMISRNASKKSPHNTKEEEEFGSPSMCAGCHQFNFPVLGEQGKLLHYTSEPMQNTVFEFSKSKAASDGLECITCHMPRGKGHRFPGAYSASMVDSALSIALCQTEEYLQVHLQNTSTAHNLPSGGINRSLVIQVWDSKNRLRGQTYRMERRFKGPIGKRVKRKDTTLAPGGEVQWEIPLLYLADGPLHKIWVESRFYFGTDPNYNHPISQRKIRKRSTHFTRVPVCVN